MPLAGQSALTNIAAAKNLRIGYPPVALVEIGPFPGGAMLRLASENFDSSDGGFSYDGHSYQARLKEQNLAAIAELSDNGIVQSPTLSIKIADADKEIYNQWERLYGLKGVKLVVKAVFVDYDARQFSSDFQIRFTGVCNAPDIDDEVLTVLATNILNLSRTFLPTSGISRQCPYPFPTNHADRVAAAINPDSDFFPCGYSYDVTDADGDGGSAAARGNGGGGGTNPDGSSAVDGSGCFTYCDGTFESCIARLGNSGLPTRTNDPGQPVQIEQDQSGRHTGRFGGIRWDPPQTWGGHAYLAGDYQQGINNANEAKYRDFVPLVFGTSFVEPPIMVVLGNPNSTKFEVVLCHGQIHDSFDTGGPIQAVICNDFVIPFVKQSTDKLLWWGWINQGSRDGNVNRDLGFDGRGDPYGYIAAIEVQVPIQVAGSSGIPNIRVLMSGPKVKVPVDASGDPAAMQLQRTSLAAPITMDLLTWCGYHANEQKNDFDLASVYAATQYCQGQVTYTNLLGQSVTHNRFDLGFALRTRRAASEVLKNILAAWRAIITPNYRLGAGDNAGKLQFIVKGSVADQQPSTQAIDGSNDGELIVSATADGTETGASSAYHFDESNILRRAGTDSPSTFSLRQRKIQDTPNILGLTFQDEDYFYNSDTINVIDSGDIGRIGQQINSGVAADGVTNGDQGRRIIQSQFAEQYRGNERSGVDGKNDSGGSLIAEWETTFQALHLCVADIVTITLAKYNLDNQTFRITGIAPTANFERLKITAQWHEDDWYQDSYGQNPSPKLQGQRLQRLLRPPFGWLPNTEAPIAGDGLYPKTLKSFAIAQAYQNGGDSVIALLVITGKLPVNDFSTKTSPPYCPQGTEGDVDSGSGDPGVPQATYYMAACAIDEDGKTTAPSWPLAKIVVDVAGKSIALNNIYTHEGTASLKIYASTNPNLLTLQKSGGVSGSVNLGKFSVSDEALPDVMFDHLVFRTKLVYHSGVFGDPVAEVVDNTHFKITAAGFSPGQFAGYIATVLGRDGSTAPLPIWNFKIANNSDDTFEIGEGVDGTTPDLTHLGVDGGGNVLALKPGDAIIMRAQGNIHNHNSIGDANFVNAVDYFDPPITIIGATNASPVVLTLNQAWDGYNDAKVYVTGVKGNASANGFFKAGFDPDNPTMVVLVNPYNDDGTLSTSPTSGAGDYEGGGTIQLITNGLKPHAESGRLVRLTYGKGAGQLRKIIDNSDTELQIDGDWLEEPDQTTGFVIEDAHWLDEVPTSPTLNADPTVDVTGKFTVDNWIGQVLWCKAFSARADGVESVPNDSPGREIYLFGGDGGNVVQYDKATFNVAIINDAVVGTDVCPHYIVRRPGPLASIVVQAKRPPTGSAMIIDIALTAADGSYSGSIFRDGPTGNIDSKRIHIPDGSTDVIEIDIASVIRDAGVVDFAINDIITINMLAVGATQPGREISIVIKWAVN